MKFYTTNDYKIIMDVIISKIIFPYTNAIDSCDDGKEHDFSQNEMYRKHVKPIQDWFKINTKIETADDHLKPINDVHLRYFCAEQQWIDLLCSEKTIQETFYSACAHGHIDVVQLLYQICPQINVQAATNDPFVAACLEGHIEVAKWLLKETVIDNIDKINYLFSFACESGHIEVAQWLKEKWPDINARFCNDDAFRFTCRNGHLNIAKWLKKIDPTINHKANNNQAFYWTCESGHLEVAKWLKENWPDIDHTILDNRALRWASEKGHKDVVNWLNSIN